MSERVDAGAREGAAITKALQSLLEKARAAGCKNPQLFFESESAAVFVLDGDHKHYINDASAGERQEAIVLMAPIRVPFDTGAW